jgi:hypothetical protein
VEEFARTGEDRPIARPPPLPTDATKATTKTESNDPLSEERSEHFDAVQPAKAHEVVHPEQKVVIREQRTLSEVAAEAGLSLADFKALSAGDRRARTMLAVRLVDQMDRTGQEATHQPQDQPATGSSRQAPERTAGTGGADLLDALPALDADGSVVAPSAPAQPAAGRAVPTVSKQSSDLLDDLPLLDADGSVVGLDDASARGSGSSVHRGRYSAHETAGALKKSHRRLRLGLLAAAAIIAAVLLLLIGWPR